MSDDLERFVLPSGELPEWARRVELFARFPDHVLLLGETGVGKTMLASTIHRLSGRSGDCHVVNLAGSTPDLQRDELFGHVRGGFTGAIERRHGLLREAGAGTLLIDEIGDASPEVQALLLPLLDSTKVGVRHVGSDRSFVPPTRFLLATNKDLVQRSNDGRFRQDLLHRIDGMTIDIPPLRERLHELRRHVDAYLRELDCTMPSAEGEPYRLSEESWERMYAYHWPGNLRELQRKVSVAVSLSRRAADVTMPAFVLPERSRLSSVSSDGAAESARLERLFLECNGNASRVAALLGVSRTTLYSKAARLGVNFDQYRRNSA